MRTTQSPILGAVRDTAKGLHKAGVMDQLTLRDFDQRCMPPVEPRRANNLVPNTKARPTEPPDHHPVRGALQGAEGSRRAARQDHRATDRRRPGLLRFDHIEFGVLDVLRGVDSIAIHHQGITGTHVAEVLFFDKDGRVRESYVRYSSPAFTVQPEPGDSGGAPQCSTCRGIAIPVHPARSTPEASPPVDHGPTFAPAQPLISRQR